MPGWVTKGAAWVARWAATPYGIVIAGAVALQCAVLAVIRLRAADPTGGDLCRDAVALRRIVRGVNPYMPITTCGTLYNLPHPPAYLLLIGPFALLPVAWGAALWDLGALCALALALALIARELRLRMAVWLLAALLALLIFWPPLLNALLEAQVAPVLLLLFTLAWRAARRGQSGQAGAWLGIATGIRLFPGLAVLYFLVRRDWRAVGMAAVACAISELLALPLVGVAGFSAYITREAPSTGAEYLINPHNVSLWGLMGMLFAGSPGHPAVIAAAALAKPAAQALALALVGALAIRTWRRRRQAFARDEATFLAYLPAMLLVSPLTWAHYFVLLLLPLIVLAARLGWLAAPPHRAAPEQRLVAWALGGALACVWINDLLARWNLLHQWPAVFALVVLATPAYALLLLTGAALARTPAAGGARAVPRARARSQ
ncbi:MAG TPA: glycosyltransferase family 87 protein [Ktedonobacterales bacterium]|nr:glycosyltransferase family 87 protein [Ktedonobacterales bacterium]